MEISTHNVKKIVRSSLTRELSKYRINKADFVGEKELSYLPFPVQNYFRFCRLVGKPKGHYAQVNWETFYLKMAPEKGWTKVQSYQYNFIDEPVRLAYMFTKLGSVIPFEGLDRYVDGHGNMLIKIARFFTLGDSKGSEMDKSALVTILAEALLIPSYALQPYITWTSIDDRSAKATLKHQGKEVSGIFYFGDSGEMVKFETSDRYYAEKDGSYTNLKWVVTISSYKEINGVKIPYELSARWHTPQGEFEYFKGKIGSVNYNIDPSLTN